MPSPSDKQPERTADPQRWQPLPPPQKNKPLLMLAATLVAAWIGFLIYLALRS